MSTKCLHLYPSPLFVSDLSAGVWLTLAAMRDASAAFSCLRPRPVPSASWAWQVREKYCHLKHYTFRIYYSIYHQIYECYIIYEYVGIFISNMNVNPYSLSIIFHKQKDRWHSLIPKDNFEEEILIEIYCNPWISLSQYTLRIISVSQCHIRMSCVLRIEFRNNMENHTYSAGSAGQLL